MFGVDFRWLLRCIALSCVLVVPTKGAAQAAAAPWARHTFSDWAVSCDAQRTCSATVWAMTPENHQVFLGVARRGDPDAQPTVTLSFEGRTARGHVLESAELHVVGRDTRSRSLLRQEVPSAVEYPVTGDTLAFTRQLVEARHVLFQIDAQVYVRISLEGSSAAMRFMDDQQRRVGTTTALVAHGTRSPQTVPPIPAPPEVRRAPRVAQNDLPTTIPEAVRALRTCDQADEVGEIFNSFTVARLARGLLLFKLSCGLDLHNLSDAYFTLDASGHARPVELEYAESMSSTRYDPETRTLVSFEQESYEEEEECGAERTWAYTGRRFVLVRYTLDRCEREAVYEARLVP